MNATGCVMAPRDVRVFGGHPHARPGGRIIRASGGFGFSHRNPARADAEIKRGVDFRVVELHQHVRAANAHLRAAESDKRRHVEAAHTHHVQFGVIGRETQLAAAFIIEIGFGLHTGSRQQRSAFIQNAPFGQCQHQLALRLALLLQGLEHRSHRKASVRGASSPQAGAVGSLNPVSVLCPPRRRPVCARHVRSHGRGDRRG